MYISRGYESQAKLMINQMNMANNKIGVHQSRIASGDSFKGGLDNPVDVVKASRAEAVMRGNRVAENNIQDALSFLQVKEGGLDKMDNIGKRLRDLAVQYNNETLVEEDRKALAFEARTLLEEMNHTLSNTTFNNVNVFGDKTLHFQAGQRSSDILTIQPTSFQINETDKNPPAGESDAVPPDNDENGSGTTTTTTTTTESSTTTTTTNNSNTNSSKGDGLLGFIGGVIGGIIGAVTGSKNDKDNSQTTETTTTTTTTVETTESNPGSVQEGDESKETEGADGINQGQEGSPLPTSEWLSPDFIDEHLLQPLASERAKVGVEANRFQVRLESVMNEGVEATDHLSRIRDTDIAKEYMEMVKQQMLADVSANMLTRSMHDRRSSVLSLLSS